MRFSIAAAALALAGCAGPNLYSPVLPMDDGSNQTAPTARTEEIALARATRNAERYCNYYSDSRRYTVVEVKSEYEGLLNSATAAKKLQKGGEVARKLSLGFISPGLETDWRTTLIFKCYE